jgi:acyl carrier protein
VSTKIQLESWIINWFKKRNPDEDVNVKDDYVSCGLIDSLGVFELVFELEDQFSFKFTDDDFKHPHFRTIYGMTQLIINQKQSL